jgi:peroxiredoxin Q/BCP
LIFPLLADPERAVLNTYGAFGTKMLYGKQVEGVIRSTFVIDVDEAGVGTISDPQYNVRATGHVAKLTKELSL